MTGRADFQERRDRKNERRRERAAKLRGEANSASTRARAMLPEFGQPILVGHHSEKRHRRSLEKSHALTHKSIEKVDHAANLERLADSSEDSRAVSSDDPEALPKLREKLAAMEARRERIKASNRAAKKVGGSVAPAYVLTNLGANIRRVAGRVAEFEAAAKVEIPADVEMGTARAHWDLDTNRVQVFSPRPTPEEREARTALMRGNGFIWARSAGCWQRLANPGAWRVALVVVQKLAGF
jgi:hypothetical protein